MVMGTTDAVHGLSEIRYAVSTDLQAFSGEKTEKATSKKRRDARMKGQVVQSKDLSVAASLMAVFFTIHILKGYLTERIFGYFRVISNMMEDPMQISELAYAAGVLGMSLETILVVALPVLTASLVAGVLVSYLQVGALFTVKTLQPKLDKINPINGFKRLFSLRAFVEMIKSILKALILLYITGTYLMARQTDLIQLINLNVQQIVAVLWDIIYNLMLRAVIVLFILAVADYAYKKWQNEKDLRMSKQEVKDEYKMTEGDPQLKGKIKQKQREISMGRMMQEVPKADVIITNPTHFAVAVHYDPDSSDAPKVVAKGKDLIAKNIRRIAEENDVPIVENKPLARALYAEVELGSYIPEELYHAVAEVLAYVYKLRKSG